MRREGHGGLDRQGVLDRDRRAGRALAAVWGGRTGDGLALVEVITAERRALDREADARERASSASPPPGAGEGRGGRGGSGGRRTPVTLSCEDREEGIAGDEAAAPSPGPGGELALRYEALKFRA